YRYGLRHRSADRDTCAGNTAATTGERTGDRWSNCRRRPPCTGLGVAESLPECGHRRLHATTPVRVAPIEACTVAGRTEMPTAAGRLLSVRVIMKDLPCRQLQL